MLIWGQIHLPKNLILAFMGITMKKKSQFYMTVSTGAAFRVWGVWTSEDEACLCSKQSVWRSEWGGFVDRKWKVNSQSKEMSFAHHWMKWGQLSSWELYDIYLIKMRKRRMSWALISTKWVTGKTLCSSCQTLLFVVLKF